MSILIKGMDMPDRCFSCPMCIEEDGEWLCNISHGPYLEYMEIPEDIAIDTRPDWCPLVELPPHGSLIEKHDVFKLISAFPEIDKLLTVEFMKALYNLPTIIPAEEVQADG